MRKGPARLPFAPRHDPALARRHGGPLAKTRSWFALGCPVQLLSPLSVLRILFALATFFWPLLSLQQGVPSRDRLAVAAAAAACGLIWLGLMQRREIGRIWSQVLVVVLVAIDSAVLISAGHGAVRTQYLLLLVPVALVAGLFFSGWEALGLHVAILVGVGVAYWTTGGPSDAVALAVASVLALGPVTLLVQLLAGAARRSGTADPDTGLLNGIGLSHQLMAQHYASFVVAVVSISGLPEAREALGYEAGSELIRRAVEELGKATPPGAIIGRVEGDELIVCVPLATTATAISSETADDLVAATSSAVALAEVLRLAVSEGRYLVDTIEVTLRAHVGLVLAPWDGHEIIELVRRASLSARHARQTGQRWSIWAGDQGTLTAEDLALLSDLRFAAQKNELRLVYQPQVSAKNGAIVAVEALLRWDSAAHGSVAPGRFIPLAERTGLIGRLTEWVVDEALDAQVRWQRLGISIPVSVNLSAKLLNRPELADDVLSRLDRRGLPAGLLTLEITETAVATDLVEIVRLLIPLRDRGVRISMDDFGTGYTTLTTLPLMPLDEIKVDRGFVSRSSTSPADDAIVRAICDLGHRLHLTVVAEGIEDPECAERMKSYGCDFLQGNYFDLPLREVVLVARLTEKRADVGAPLDPTARH